MKKRRISTSIIALLTLSSLAMPIQAQVAGNKPLTKEEWKATPLYQGTMVGVDVAGFKGIGKRHHQCRSQRASESEEPFFPYR